MWGCLAGQELPHIAGAKFMMVQTADLCWKIRVLI